VSISSTFFASVFRTNFWRQVMLQIGAQNLYKKCTQKTLMKLTVGVPNNRVWKCLTQEFCINVLLDSCTGLSIHIFASGCISFEGVTRPGVNFINILRTNFSYERHFSMYMLLEKAAETQRLYEKFVSLTLMKLTTAFYSCLTQSRRFDTFSSSIGKECVLD